MQNLLRFVWAFAVYILLVSCGGGGQDSGQPPAASAPPQPPAAPAPPQPPAAVTLDVSFGIKEIRFSWASAADATSYQLLVNPDGLSGFTPVGDVLPAGSTRTTRQVAVHRHNWQHARYLIEACNSAGCSRSRDVSTSQVMLATIGYLKAGNARQHSRFGEAVALSGDGNTLVVGAGLESSDITGSAYSTNHGKSGAVYVFVRNADGWRQQAFLKHPTTDVFDRFGHSVSLSHDGDTLAIGAFGVASDAGAAYVYTRTAGVWSSQPRITAPNFQSMDGFGYQVALSSDGNTLAVSAISEDSDATGVGGDQFNNRSSEAGAVFVYTLASGAWTQQAYVKASNTGVNDHFGKSVALDGDGDTLAVGANQESSNATGIDGDQTNDLESFSGAAYVFIRANGVWSQQAYVKASNSNFLHGFGYSIALADDGNTLAVGAPRGAETHLFFRSGNQWSQQAVVRTPSIVRTDYFGCSVSLSRDGSTLAVGAQFESSNATGVDGDPFGGSMYSSGAVYVFSRVGESWSPATYVKAINPDVDDVFGAAVALSSDGSTLAVGARGEQSASAGFDGSPLNNMAPDAGAVYLY